ncbi:MAG: KpsF/GutQ family sugar-phosphate isomerase [Armatimonadota bacterium]|nr:KpsF/GutQ family sugar-phosphate isomerase [Armatimonadota bacterium]MCX7776444.1 KpsF/GutQ family sugar-phosphate isomerase [Armatimonadota bacterium]MDW8024242.1 KpsF/GutQ family sugar-phosphate isomerase [Armatimonadota bacterium]
MSSGEQRLSEIQGDGVNEPKDVIELVRDVMRTEAEAILEATKRVGDEFVKAINMILNCRGKVVVTGVGKSGAIARKIAATLCSTGTPSLFLHPAEGVHGDIGAVTSDDLLIAISYSGESDELRLLLPALKRIGVPIIAMTGNRLSLLARHADVVIDISVEREACPLNLAPTASTTLSLAIGDALALATMKLKRFTKEDFARFHPGGALGRRLLLRVRDLMRTGDRLAKVKYDQPAIMAYVVITKARAGACVVVDDDGKLLGIVTDGDMRRAVLKDIDALNEPITKVMTSNPKTISPEALATEALRLMQLHSIDDLPVVDDDGRPIGMLDVQDLLSAGIV